MESRDLLSSGFRSYALFCKPARWCIGKTLSRFHSKMYVCHAWFVTQRRRSALDELQMREYFTEGDLISVSPLEGVAWESMGGCGLEGSDQIFITG